MLRVLGQDAGGGPVASPQVCRGMAMLLRASNYARDVTRDVWDFAVEIPNLEAVGLTSSDFRWLVCKGYVQHAQEITATAESKRRFGEAGGLVFASRSCFVLTPAGVEAAQRLAREVLATSDPPGQNGSLLNQRQPTWDQQRREFRVGELVVKHFRVPSPNQERVLSAFQEEGWPLRIDDPLPPNAQMDSKRRLHDTIKSLNRNQRIRLIGFHGDGTGEGICWELLMERTNVRRRK